MAFRSAGKIAITLAQRTGAFASGRSYIQRYFPPGYREPALKLVKAFEQAATGAGLYQVVSTIYNNNNNGVPFSGTVQKRNGFKTHRQFKKRSRFVKHPRRFNKYCPPRPYRRC